jgi:hypothetical protein
VRSFQRELQKFKLEEGEDAFSGTLLPFALRFGLVSGDQWPLARFAHDWVRTFGDPAGWRPAQPERQSYDNFGPVIPAMRMPHM